LTIFFRKNICLTIIDLYLCLYAQQKTSYNNQSETLNEWNLCLWVKRNSLNDYQMNTMQSNWFMFVKLIWSECPSQCTRRCGQTQYHKPCMFFCQKCCAKCLCVPPGYYGNKSVCPCYNNWKTKRGGPKCPWNWNKLWSLI